MMLKVYSIKDRATGALNNPFFMLTRAEAIRAFTTMANDPETNICKYPHDYSLMEIGEFNNIDGKFTNEMIDLGMAVIYIFKDEEETQIPLQEHPVDLQAVGDN